MKQVLSEQFLRMSKLAGLLTENEITNNKQFIENHLKSKLGTYLDGADGPEWEEYDENGNAVVTWEKSEFGNKEWYEDANDFLAIVEELKNKGPLNTDFNFGDENGGIKSVTFKNSNGDIKAIFEP